MEEETIVVAGVSNNLRNIIKRAMKTLDERSTLSPPTHARIGDPNYVEKMDEVAEEREKQWKRRQYLKDRSEAYRREHGREEQRKYFSRYPFDDLVPDERAAAEVRAARERLNMPERREMTPEERHERAERTRNDRMMIEDWDRKGIK